MDYEQVTEATELLKNPKATLTDLLECHGKLEREYGSTKSMIIVGMSEDVKSLWQIAILVDALKIKIQKLHL